MKIGKYTKESLSDIYKTGVYGIVHSSHPDIYYVGSAISAKKYGGFASRWSKHLSELSKNKHHSNYLQKVVNKYGFEGLDFFIITECSSEQALGIEQYWINMLNSKYNSCRCVFNAKENAPRQEAVQKFMIEVSQYDLEGKYVATYPSIAEAERVTKISCIHAATSDRYCRVGNFMWKKFKSVGGIPPYTYPHKRKINCFLSTGELYKTYNSISEAATELNLNTANISKNLQGIKNIVKGYMFKDYNKGELSIPPYQHKRCKYNIVIKALDTNEILKVTYLTDLEKEGMCRSHIRKALKTDGFYKSIKRNIKIEYLCD